MTAEVSDLTPGDVNTIKLVISDVSDSRLDSAVFLQRGSFSSQRVDVELPPPGLYTHDFEVEDVENDTPFEFFFDPDFVDSSGNIITHGAELTDSGREDMINDRFNWTPSGSYD